MDINPVVDRVRLVNDAGISLRVNPVTGVATQDTSLNPGTPNVTAVAYSNNFSGAASTTLYDIDTGSDCSRGQNPPNNGTLSTVGIPGASMSARPPASTSTARHRVCRPVRGRRQRPLHDRSRHRRGLGGVSTGASLLDGLTAYSPAPAPVRVDVPSRVVTETSGTTPITLRRTGGSLLVPVTVDVTVGGRDRHQPR